MRRLVYPLLTLLLLAGSCSTPQPLRDEEHTQPYAHWAHARGAGYSRTSETLDASAPGAEPLRMRVVALKSAEPVDGRLLVLQPGVLADHRTWRFLAPLLAERNHVLLVDPPGTGGSAAPDPDRHPEPAYTPGWIGRHTLRAVDRWQRRHGDTRRLVFVAHSLGSAALVRALTEPATREDLVAVRSRVDGLVLLTLPDVLMKGAPEKLEQVAGLSDLEIRAGMALGILDRELADATWKGVVNPGQRALQQEATRLRAMIADPRTRRPAQAMLRRFRPVSADGRVRLDAARAIAARQRGLDVPVLLLWGRHDDTLPFSMVADLRRRLPTFAFREIADAKHSIHQERADLVAWLVAGFLSKHPSAGALR